MLTVRKNFFGLLLAVLVFTSSGVQAQQTDIYFLIKKNFSILSKAYEHIALEYVDEVDPEVLMRNGLDAMLETLDPYTVLFNESQNEQAEIMSRGNYAGIGIEAGYRDGDVVVVAPVEGGPADKVGIRAGDVIVAVDGVSTENMQPEEVLNLTSGEVGSAVTITIERYGLQQALDFELTRARIEVKNVTYSGFIGEQENVGYIKLAQFGMGASDEVRSAIKSLSEKKDVTGLVLDLRDNPGGILQEAVSIVDKFVEPGITAVETRGRVAEYNEQYRTREPVMFNKPVAVLMSQGSASASEVVAGALQDLDRAVIIGEQSFGKGLVQVVKPLPYNTSLKITISRYYTPSGRSIQSIEYTHKGGNSGVINSDTSRKEYKTRNGRTVYEGRGIEPDIELKKEELSLLQIALLQQGMYFDFATEFEAENTTFEADRLPGEVFAEFRAFLRENDFSYKTESQKLLEDLEAELASAEGVNSELETLRDFIEKEKEAQFREDETAIRNSLFLELSSRYRGQSGKTRESLEIDPQVLKAIELINKPDELSNLLAGR